MHHSNKTLHHPRAGPKYIFASLETNLQALQKVGIAKTEITAGLLKAAKYRAQVTLHVGGGETEGSEESNTTLCLLATGKQLFVSQW